MDWWVRIQFQAIGRQDLNFILYTPDSKQSSNDQASSITLLLSRSKSAESKCNSVLASAIFRRVYRALTLVVE